MRLEDNDFFYDNIAYVNKLVAKILSLTVLLSPTFYLLSKYGIFNISRTYVLVTLFLTVPFSISSCFLFRVKIFQRKIYRTLLFYTKICHVFWTLHFFCNSWNYRNKFPHRNIHLVRNHNFLKLSVLQYNSNKDHDHSFVRSYACKPVLQIYEQNQRRNDRHESYS